MNLYLYFHNSWHNRPRAERLHPDLLFSTNSLDTQNRTASAVRVDAIDIILVLNVNYPFTKISSTKTEDKMKFYTGQHSYYCGIDLHARSMYVCIIDQNSKTWVHKNISTDPEALMKIIDPYISEMVPCLNFIITGVTQNHNLFL